MPFLGWKEFGPSYFGPFRTGARVEAVINTTIPSMLREVFSDGYASEPRFTFDQNVLVRNGVLEFSRTGEADA